MEKIKQLNTLIEQTCSDIHNQPPVKLYNEILHLIESRVDLPKHSIAAIAKKLTSKSKKTLFITFDLLQYLSYNLQLPFYSQIATKQFLFKISGLMMNKQTDPLIMDKILKLVKCLDQLFRPLEDFLPLFFQFEAGLLRKQYQIPYEYISAYRPKQLKQYKKVQKQESVSKKPVIQPTKDEQKRFEQIRQKIILTNEIISNCDPAEDIRKNDLLQQLMQQLKKSQKSINQTIDQNPSQKILQLALATNDDLVTTYRRYKDLQRNRKPETFFMAELASDILKEETVKTTKRTTQMKKPSSKIQQKPQPQRYQSIFEAFQQPSPSKKVQQQIIKAPVLAATTTYKQQAKDIFDLVDSTDNQSQTTQITNAMDILDISGPQSQVKQTNSSLNLDFLGGSANKSQFTSNVADIFSIDLGLNLNNNNNNQVPVVQNNLYQQQQQQQPSIYQSQSQSLQQQPVYQQQQQPQLLNYQTSYQPQQQPLYMQNFGDQFNLNTQYMTQSIPSQLQQQQSNPLYSGITLNLSEQPKIQEKKITDPQKEITDLSEFKF